MLRSFKNHPFAVEAFFKSSIILTFAVRKQQLQNFIPEPLQLETHQDEWAFIAVALVQTTELRPKGFPKLFGSDFTLIGYRVFVRYINNSRKRLRGLYIIKSETNKKRMKILGNIFTNYNYDTIDIQNLVKEEITEIKSKKSNFAITIDRTKKEIQIPTGSPLTDWKSARKFSGPLPFTFTYNPVDKTVLIVEGVRQNWHPKPIKVLSCHFKYLQDLRITDAILASAFEVQNVPYLWKKGEIEKWL